MANAIQPHNARPAAIWSSGGSAYDIVSRGVSDAIEHCVARLDPQPGQRILDLATGTGWTSRVVCRRGAHVTGADIAEGLLEAARDRAKHEGLDIEYRVADAERLPFGDGEFDGLVSTFGVMFASRPEAAAAEITRVVKPGGRLALATWTHDGTLAAMFQVMKPYMPPPPSPAPPSPFEWGRTARITELLGDAFDLHFEPGVSNYRIPDGETTWRQFSVGYGPTKMLAQSLDDTRREALHREFAAFHDQFKAPIGLCVTREYLVTLGIRR